MISRKQEKCAPELLLEYAHSLDIELPSNRFLSAQHVYQLIWLIIPRDKHQLEPAKWYVLGVAQHIAGRQLRHLKDAVLSMDEAEHVAKQLLQGSKVKTSLLRQMEFEEWFTPVNFTSDPYKTSASTRTLAYKKTVELLEQHVDFGSRQLRKRTADGIGMLRPSQPQRRRPPPESRPLHAEKRSYVRPKKHRRVAALFAITILILLLVTGFLVVR